MSTGHDHRAPSTELPRVAFVGTGPGDPGLMTMRGAELIAAADVLVVDPGTAEVLAAHSIPEVEVVEACHADRGTALTRAARARLVVSTAKAVAKRTAPNRGLVVRVTTGDVGRSGTLTTELSACHKAGIEVEVVPGVDSAQAASAYAGVPLSTDASPTVLTYAGNPAKADFGAAASESVTVVVHGEPEQLADALARVLKAGRDASTPVALTEHGTTTKQHTYTSSLAEAIDALEAGRAGEPSVAVVGRGVDQRDELSWFETRPLFGWRVLLPRTKDQSETTLSRLTMYGARGEVVPTISVEPPRTPQQMQRAIKGLVTGRYEWVGFTSVNAVKAVKEKLAEIGLDVRAFAGLKIAAVGGVTADALRDWGLEPDLVPSGESSAQGLLDEWPPYDDVLDPINGVFLPRADIATDTLVAGLQGMGWEVDDVTAYRTVRAAPPPAPVREAIKSGAYDAVLFTSSSTVRNLVGIAGKPHPSTVVACIGPATAKTAQEHGLSVAVLAEEASSEALVDALAAYGRGLRAEAMAAGEDVVRPSDRRTTGRRKAR
ncbi:uroporphyrinogen-III synthase [Agilicoccus flavus]|uniref:uroporphyrinogen-III synthase n=1 Tax=Agilicoccus flavus TaxID=2775968 RepID=UPI003558B31B